MLIVATIYYILSSAITTRRDNTIYYNRFLVIILLYTILISSNNLIIECKNIGLLNNFFNISSVNTVFSIFVLILTISVLNINSFFARKLEFINKKNTFLLNKITNKSGEQYKIIEYPLIILFIIIGAIFLINSNDIVSIFLSIELQSYGLYLLCTLYRNSELSTSAGLTYFLLGSLASCLILLGTSLLYANSGTTNLDNYYIIINIYDIMYNKQYALNYTNYSLLIMSVGFLFKISAAPFHFWSPDVYDAVPTISTTFIAIVTKISIFILFLEFVNYTKSSMFDMNWTLVLLYSSLLSLIIGTILGLNQSRIKRLFAYSTISHLGFILLALSINSVESTQAFIFYVLQYSLSNLNLFIVLICMGYLLYIYSSKQENNLSDKDNSPVQYIFQLKGFIEINPVLSISLAITIYSLIGIPPLLGFFGKQMVLSSSIDSNYIFITIIAILTSVISAVYYLSIVKTIFFETSEYEKNSNTQNIASILSNKYETYNNISLSGNLSLSVSILTLIILLFIISPDEWLNLANILATTIYIY